jgi:hypothetical protein
MSLRLAERWYPIGSQDMGDESGGGSCCFMP